MAIHEHSRSFPVIEAVLLFSVFYLPGYIRQSGAFDVQFFLRPLFHLHYLVTAIPQILLLIYLLSRSGAYGLSAYGLLRPKLRALPRSLLTFIAVSLLAASIALFSFSLGAEAPFPVGNGAERGIAAGAELPFFVYLLIFTTCLVVGYHEELFFRSYLLTEFIDGESAKGRNRVVVFAASLLFASGHIYQGVTGFAGTFAIGIFLSYRFLRRRCLHEVAIAHGLYNFAAILVLLSVGNY
jgi:uncharacterized protein